MFVTFGLHYAGNTCDDYAMTISYQQCERNAPRSTVLSIVLLLLAVGCTPRYSDHPFTLQPAVETDTVVSNEDAADDPAIWVDRADPVNSLVIGTDKVAGIRVYDLNGSEVQFLPVGRVNNVAVLQGVSTADGNRIDLVGASNRTFNGWSYFRVGDAGLSELEVSNNASRLDEVYGYCLYSGSDDRAYSFTVGKSGRIEQHRVRADGDRVALEWVRELQLPSQGEGCVVDLEAGWLYVGEERGGLWRFPLDLNGSNAGERFFTLDEAAEAQGIVGDLEGLALWRDDQRHWLFVSVQGNNRYAIFDLSQEPPAVIEQFIIADTADGAIDGVQETDGLEVTPVALNGQFPNGLLVVQDGVNPPEGLQNFKLVDPRPLLDRD